MPPLAPGLHFVEVAAGGYQNDGHTLARLNDGSVVAWGFDDFGQCAVPRLPSGWTFARLATGQKWSAAIIRSGGYATFATGCPGSAGTTRLESTALPRIGQQALVFDPAAGNPAGLVLSDAATAVVGR